MGEAKLKVVLLKHTPEPEAVVAMAAKLCYSSANIDELKKNIEAKDQKKFIEKLVKMGHLSPIEHISFTFGIEGISRACSHQLVRHRLASYSQQSQRYVSERSQESEVRSQELTFDYIIPPSITEDKEARDAFERFMAEAQKAYDLIVDRLNKKGISGEAANQDARFVLPNAAETKIVVTMNARELLHFFNVRCCERAQWEIREMAFQMLQEAKKAAPVIFSKAGPGCLYAQCTEGEFYCGKIKEVRERFGVIKG
ncbi:MAG: FAD-dependent thymidylate synthase [Nitrospirae bacterium]|nr:FAD-dependent thymidylate synthase [Nitrospirota bacterium]